MWLDDRLCSRGEPTIEAFTRLDEEACPALAPDPRVKVLPAAASREGHDPVHQSLVAQPAEQLHGPRPALETVVDKPLQPLAGAAQGQDRVEGAEDAVWLARPVH